MKKLTIVFVILLGALFMYILITRPYERNYNIDEEAGMKNIMEKMKDLAGNSSIYQIRISSQPEQGDMDYLTLSVIDPENDNHREIKFNRSGAFSNSVESKDLGPKGTRTAFDISNMLNSLNVIEECKKLMPEGYSYRHTECIVINNDRIASIKVAVAADNDNDIKKNKHVHLQTYTKESYSGSKRRKKKIQTTHTYYIMEFDVNKNGEISGKSSSD